MKEKIHVMVIGIPFHEGMAGTKRVRNLLVPLVLDNQISVSNLVLTDIFEKEKIGLSGSSDGIEYRYIGYKSFKNIPSVFRFYKEGFRFLNYQKKSTTHRVAYFYGYADLKNLLLILYARFKKYKVVFDIVEDNRLNSNFHGVAGKIRNYTSLLLLKSLPKFADAVLVISLHLETWLKSILKNKTAVYNIPITIDTRQYDREIPLHEANEKRTVKIFYGGSFAQKDGLEFLMEAFLKVNKLYNNVELILTGGGHGSYMNDVLARIKKHDNIKYLGFLSTEEYYNTLYSADICCMTRNNSQFANAGFPFKLGEFLAAGKAIIATTVGDVPMYLKNGENAVLVEPESVEQIQEALILLIENKNDIRLKLGQAAKSTALQYFDGRKLSRKLLSAFYDLYKNTSLKK